MKTTRTRVLLGAMVAVVIGGLMPARAQPPSQAALTGGDDEPWNRGVSMESRRAARELFLVGNRLFRVPLFAKAAAQYAAALGKWKHPAFYFNLALAQLNLGQEVEARANLEEALRHGEAPLGVEEFREARRQLREVERQLGRIRVTCQTPGAEVTLDGATLFIGPGSYQGWAKAKDHELTAKKPGYLSEARRVTVSSGELRELELELVTLGEATDASRRWAAWKPWTVVAAGAGVAVAGGVMHTLSSRNTNAYDEGFAALDCATPSGDPPRTSGCTEGDIGAALNAQLRLARRQQTIATGAYIAGGSLFAAGVVLLYLNRPRTAEQGAASRPARSVEVVPAVSGEMLGISVSVTH